MTAPPPLSPDDIHDEVAILLPWYVNGTLAGEERLRTKTHIEHCPACREELARQRLLASHVADAPIPQRSPQAAYGRLLDTVQRRKTPAHVPSLRGRAPKNSRWRPLFARHNVPPMAVAAAVLLVLLVPLGWRQAAHMAEANFHTLSDRTPAATGQRGDLRLVFDKTVPAARMDDWLQAIGGSRIAGPGPGDVYTVHLSGKADIAAAIAYLRQQDGVLLVEPIASPP